MNFPCLFVFLLAEMTIPVLALFISGLVLLVIGAELLVRGASRLAVLAGISPLVIGLTVVAFGTSSPEMAVSLQANFTGQTGISIGNVVGSNICNVLLILGVSAIIAPLAVSEQLVRLDVPIMIGISVLTLFFALDGIIGRLDGLLFFSGIVVYIAFLLVQSRRKPEMQAELLEEVSFPPERSHRQWLINLGLIGIGLVMLVIGSQWLVEGATAIAETLGVSDLVIGLTIVALGTSLPELATSVIACFRGERDIAVGNAIGSNIFNLLAVLGLAAVIDPDGIDVAAAALRFDIPVMIAVAVACLPIFFTGNVISRWEGLLFFGYYIFYTAYLILKSTEHDSLPIFSAVMLVFVIPLTVITLVVITVSHIRKHCKRSRRNRRDHRSS